MKQIEFFFNQKKTLFYSSCIMILNQRLLMICKTEDGKKNIVAEMTTIKEIIQT